MRKKILQLGKQVRFDFLLFFLSMTLNIEPRMAFSIAVFTVLIQRPALITLQTVDHRFPHRQLQINTTDGVVLLLYWTDA